MKKQRVWVIWLWEEDEFIKWAFLKKKDALKMIKDDGLEEKDYYLTDLEIY